jgi:hypothetical protein
MRHSSMPEGDFSSTPWLNDLRVYRFTGVLQPEQNFPRSIGSNPPSIMSWTPDAGAHNPPVTKPRGLDFEMWLYKGRRAQHEEEKAPIMPVNPPAWTSKAPSGPSAIYSGEPD